MKRDHRDSNIEKANTQKDLEEKMDQKKKEMYQNLRLGNSLRQTADVKSEENKYYNSYSKIHDLEMAEKSMISKLGHSQTRHMQIMTDYERIMNNQEPLGPLVELQTKIDLSRSGSSRYFLVNAIRHSYPRLEYFLQHGPHQTKLSLQKYSEQCPEGQ
jgi:hypothetical protein